MGELSDWIRSNAKEGADTSAAEALVEKYTIENITSKEQAINFMKKTDVFVRGLDSLVSDAVNNHDRRFQEEKLPGIVEAEKARIKLELNPPKTEAEKRLYDAEQKIAAMEAKDAEWRLKEALSVKAREIGFPVARVGRYSVYGDRAAEEMEADLEWKKEAVKESLEAEIKNRFGGDAPKKQEGDPAKIMGRAEFDTLDPAQKSEYVKAGGKVTN